MLTASRLLGWSMAVAMKTFYRIIHKSKSGLIKSPNFYDLKTAKRIADDLNQKLEDLGEYSIESADISELNPNQLVRLYRLKLIPYPELSTYAGLHIAEQELKHKYSNQHFA